MQFTTTRPDSRDDRIAIGLRIIAVALALTTAAIHLSLGGILFLLNAAGYAVLAAGLVVPGSFAERFRWGPRLALLGFTATTIAAWVTFGARYDMAYLAKAVEFGLVAVLLVDLQHAYGHPLSLARRILGDIGSLRDSLRKAVAGA